MDKSQTISPTRNVDPSQDILQRARTGVLDCIFSPHSVAIIGATETAGSVGRTLVENIQRGGFKGPIYPINLKRPSVLGLKAYPSITAVPDKVELAVIATPPATVPSVIRECALAGVKGAIIISAGFKETGEAGAQLERQVLQEARKAGIRIVGPNCLGVMLPHGLLNATFAADMARPGPIGFISQSGALCTAVLDWSLRENVGFSAFVSLGSMLDVGWGDLISHLGNDPKTTSIVMYMETIGDARAFLSAAREVSLTKPIIVIKPGRSAAAAKAAASHTGSLTGSDEVLQAAFQRAGVLRVDTISELFDMAEVLSKQPLPKGPHLTIVTNAGGPAVLATDMLIGSGGQLADLSQETMQSFNSILPPTWSHNNPVDIIGDASPQLYTDAVEIALKDPQTDGLLVILTPQAMTDATVTAEFLGRCGQSETKPIIASWMGAGQVEKGEDILNAAKIPTFKYPDRAARAFCCMWQYSDDLRALYETPAPAEENDDAEGVRMTGAAELERIRSSGRTILTEFESKSFLSNYGIPTVETRIARTEMKAVDFAKQIGYPVVLKLFSETITHKTDVGGVQLNLQNAAAVRKAWKLIQAAVTQKAGAENFMGVTVQPMIKLEGYELIIGSSIDAQFGPVILFGTGGQLVEVFKDRALGLPPFNRTLARRLMEQTKIFTALKGVRGRKAVNLDGLEQTLVHFSRLVTDQPWISEIDINPLLVSPERILALDARIVLHDTTTPVEKLPKPCIRPYPAKYTGWWTSKANSRLLIRPIRPEDEPLIVKFHSKLSERTVYQAYFGAFQFSQRTAHKRLSRICCIDYDREIALVAESRDPDGCGQILAVARLRKIQGSNEGAFVLLVADPAQSLGLEGELLNRLVQVARDEKLTRISAPILRDNEALKAVCEKAGFKVSQQPENGQYLAEFQIT